MRAEPRLRVREVVRALLGRRRRRRYDHTLDADDGVTRPSELGVVEVEVIALRRLERVMTARVAQVAEQKLEAVRRGPANGTLRAAAEPDAIAQAVDVRLDPRHLRPIRGVQRLISQHLPLERDEEALDEDVRVERVIRPAQRRQQVAVRRRCADADVDATARERVDGAVVLGEAEGRLVAERHDIGLEPDPPGALGGRREERQRGRDAPLEMALTDAGHVVAELLAEGEQPKRCLQPRTGIPRGVVPREDESCAGNPAARHEASFHAPTSDSRRESAPSVTPCTATCVPTIDVSSWTGIW